jgi:hypothetical protein
MSAVAIFVIPAPGREVVYPPTMRLLDAAGALVSSDDLFWSRRIRDADVINTTAALGCIWDNYFPPQPDTPTDWDDGATDWDAPG